MKKIEKLAELLNLWNEISNYTYTFEIIGSRLYIKNVITIEAVTKLYSMLQMVDTVTYIRTEEPYDVELEVLEI